jgi:hypothetical protein
LSKGLDEYKVKTELTQLLKTERATSLDIAIGMGDETPEDNINSVNVGEFVAFYKSINGPKRPDCKDEPDWEKYEDLLLNSCRQLFPDADEILKGIKKLPVTFVKKN